ncbi:FliH/SctL family protein [Anaeromyxobacter terrae]|uniref:FliH/SctL family protein n=1 Tax=Anaeromyxobacter terrae TaxID=2925406 RepID=UPI001F57950B|nr:FliH/SctL family protein [Anaeromyxobacter sp. SG22]
MAKILKGQPPAGAGRIEAAAYEARERARALLAAAEEEARRIRAEAESERERLRAEAAEEGRREGLARAAASLAAAAAARDRRLALAEREVSAAAVDVARTIIGRELSQDPGAVADLAARALAAARDRREVTLRVNPADAEAIRTAAGRLAAVLARAPGLTVREDAALARGDAVVETEAGRVDARVETQLAALARALDEDPR